ncbi:PREDICTED: uncharacterized protein LOC105360826 [Ceratosolen solmsi marchali]|uniref:Uncharacterized protein LOC105360826 n=1 Tax=Ceratosolen solmsi marchali TaxID=326594 RepID=A0AAJ6YDM4_9HYME|nr:PREDICTED: uncharacterized protein LOC105360826 [Ceratosolen solmsi marchali]
MQNNKNDKNKEKKHSLVVNEMFDVNRIKLDKLCKCDRIISDCDMKFYDLSKFNKNKKDINYYNDEYNEDLEDEFFKLIYVLDLPESTHSLTKIETNLPSCLKYGFRSGLTHMYMRKFPPLTRGYQGSAIAVAAIATSFLVKPQCWNEFVIDQVLEDGDTYYSDSYENIVIADRRTLTLQDFKRHINIQNTHRIFLKIDGPIYAGTFRTDSPKELHVAKALHLFFKKYDAGVLTSPILNIAIWKNEKHFHIFDGQPRLDNCDISDRESNGTAKLILVQNLSGVLFIILQKSNIKNESFTIYGTTVVNAKKISELPENYEKFLTLPQRRPSGYCIQETFRAVAQGTYHLHHPIFPGEFCGRGHLIVAVSALIYSKLLNASKWTTAIIDLILNYSNIYLTDIVRVLGKTLDDTFEMSINDLLTDIVFGVYTAKIKVEENVFPGENNKSKESIEDCIRKFFTTYSLGILEIQKTFYAIWKGNDKFYFFDPFACDSTGFRVSLNNPDDADQYKKAAACITMNSSINQLSEVIIENTEYIDKNPFIIHGFHVLYVKTGIAIDGSDEKIVFREKNTYRRPSRPPSPSLTENNECGNLANMPVTPRFEIEKPISEKIQYPELMDGVDQFVVTFDELNTADEIALCSDSTYYEIVKPHRLILQGTNNCLDEQFKIQCRGRQGLIIAIAALTQVKQTNVTNWTSIQIDKIVSSGNGVYEKLANSIIEALEKEKPENKKLDTENTKKFKPKILDHLDLSMLQKTIKINDTRINIASKMNIIEGEANPLINLEEAFGRYFEQFNELILENKKLIYSVWKNNDKYFIFNPYGSDKKGWQNTSTPAALFVVDCVSELIDLCYGFFEFNDYHFIFHFIQITLFSSNESKNDTAILPKFEVFENYKTKFLPITDDDLAKIKQENKNIEKSDRINNSTIKNNRSENATETIETTIKTKPKSKEPADAKNVVTNLFEHINEPQQPNAPVRLNFALITGIVKIEQVNECKMHEENLELLYEKLKYNHPPPFVMPPKKNFCNLLDVKLASKSIHSLLSRFSVDSKLSIKEKNILQSTEQEAIISLLEKNEKSKVITLPSKQYFILRSLPNGLMPIRAINEQFIHDECNEEKKIEEECKSKEKEIELVQEPKICPLIIPCGSCIKTPDPKKLPDCPENYNKKCSLNTMEEEDTVLKKLVCSTENLLLEVMLPDFKENVSEWHCDCQSDEVVDNKDMEIKREKYLEIIPCGFKVTDDENIGIINANVHLEDRTEINKSHYKSCYFSAIICILTKINLDVNKFNCDVLDRFILIANEITMGVGNFRYKIIRWFRNFYILGVKCNIIVKQIQYFDPENYEFDNIKCCLQSFFCKHQSGILVFENISFAFWIMNGVYYLFDAYSCDKNGRVSNDGAACLMEICNFESFVCRIIENTGISSSKPYRLYIILITHMEKKAKRKIKKKRFKTCKAPEIEENCSTIEETKKTETQINKLESEVSLNEIIDWITDVTIEKSLEVTPLDTKIPKFLAFKNYNASILEVPIANNEVEKMRLLFYDKKFYKYSIFRQSLDLCVIAWSQIYEPQTWTTQTIQALYETSKDYTLDSLLASEDSTVSRITDNLITEFNIANYNFRVAFAPLHTGTLYSSTGWNLAMSIKRIFDSQIYTGAILVCAKVHIGLMRIESRFYAWWLVKKNKSIKIIISENKEDYLKLIVKEINLPVEIEFSIRIVTISYAKMFGPNCSDLEGLHELITTSVSEAEIHRKQTEYYCLDDIFRVVDKPQTPLFILGTVALSERDLVIEPYIKRCYFVALFSLILKRDIIQNPLPGMIDKVLELAESSYKLFEKPKFHSEHILKDVNLMDRIFDIRDCAFNLVHLQDEKGSTIIFFDTIRKELKQFFKKYTSGIIQFSNCCYGFWYCNAKKCYYYLDPYQCDTQGRRVGLCGSSCLCIFPSISCMVSHMSLNQYKNTTGFFIHRIHVESVNSSPYDKFQEDPIWVYLDYHWSYRHTISKNSRKIKSLNNENLIEKSKKLTWKSYIIEVPNVIYSLWGSIGAFDVKYCNQAGKNQIAIAISVFAMCNLCQPSEWHSTILNAAVIFGNYYYKKSNKIHPRCLNKFNLLDFIKISYFQWNIEFNLDVCGVLYASNNERNLIDAFKMASSRSSNILFQCDKKILAIIKTSDAFYAVDSSWSGPPLFNNNYGAIYAIRCKNMNTLIYVIIKMLNTNQKLEFKFTPVKLTFTQEMCQSGDKKFQFSLKKLLETPVHPPSHTIVFPHLVSGSIAVSDEDLYMCYKNSLKLGLANYMKFKNLSREIINECKQDCCLFKRKKKNNKKMEFPKNSKASRISSEIVSISRAEKPNQTR